MPARKRRYITSASLLADLTEQLPLAWLARGSAEDQAEDGAGSDGEGGTEAVAQEERPTPGRAAKRAKIDGIWASLQQAGGGRPAGQGYGAAARLASGDIGKGTTLASLCQPIQPSQPAVDPDKVRLRGDG